MFTVERHKKIKEILHSKKSVSVPDLSGLLDVSESTIRRDLHVMEQNKLIQRTHGGAGGVGPPTDNDHAEITDVMIDNVGGAGAGDTEGDTRTTDAHTHTIAIGYGEFSDNSETENRSPYMAMYFIERFE